jgi:hypothetical protein
MRPNHQNNKRMRGRGRGNGGGNKGPNPLTRSYESNGPDVKIRGTAQHIAEKYLQLGRDAQATGDYVAAENYFQHGEHYLRIIATAQEQQRLANPHYRASEGADQDEGDDEDDAAPFAPGTPQPEVRFTHMQGMGEQPDIQPRERREFREPRDMHETREPREFRTPREPREYREPREPREFREPRAESSDGDTPREGGQRFERRDRYGRRNFRQDRDQNNDQEMEARPAGLPAFITTPSRAVSDELPLGDPQEPLTLHEDNEGEAFAAPERRRRGRPRKESVDFGNKSE